MRLGDASRSDAGEVRILLVADVRLYREGMRATLSARDPLSVVAAVASIEEAVDVAGAAAPDVIIVDMATTDSLSKIRLLREVQPGIPVVGFGVDEVEGQILACAEAGLAGYVPCDASVDDLVLRVQSALRGELLCPPRVAAALFRQLERRPAEQPRASGLLLTPREREVLRLIDDGLSNKEIALRLDIEVSTVKNHVHNVLDKLHVGSRMQAAAQLGTHLSIRRRAVASPAIVGRD